MRHFRASTVMKLKERTLYNWLTWTERQRGVREIGKRVEERWMRECWKYWLLNVEVSRKERKDEELAKSWWERKEKAQGFMNFIANRARKKVARTNAERAGKWRLESIKSSGFSRFVAVSKRIIFSRGVEREALRVGIKFRSDFTKQKMVRKMVRETELSVQARESLKRAVRWWEIGRLKVGMTRFYLCVRMRRMRRRRERRAKLDVLARLAEVRVSKKKLKTIVRTIGRKVDQRIGKECWQRWRETWKEKKGENALLLRAEKFWEDKVAYQALRRWSVRSLRRVAGYQIADRFRARKVLSVWGRLAEGWGDERVAIWRGERWREIRGMETGLRALRELRQIKKWERDSLEVWRAKGKVTSLSSIWMCFRKLSFMRKLKVEANVNARALGARRRLQTLRKCFAEIKDVAVLWNKVEAIFDTWRDKAETDKEGLVKAAKMGRKLKKRRALRAWLTELQNTKKLKEAENMWRLRMLKICVRKIREYKNAQLRIPVQQGERKRVVLRKMRVAVLKLQLSRAHWTRNLVRRCFSCWRQYDILLAQNAGNFRRRVLMELGFRGLQAGEKLGRRGRWIGKLMGGRREISGGYADRHESQKEQEGMGGGGSMFSPVISRKRGYS